MMKPEVKRKWIDALRSGLYKQSKGSLRIDNGFCCLGVLCDIASKENVGQWSNISESSPCLFEDNEKTLSHSNHLSSNYLTEAVKQWAGIDRFSPIITRPKELCLANINDDGTSFSEIADLIEAQL